MDNWSIPPSLEGKGYQVTISVVLDRQGKILQREFERKSGNSLFDQLAMRAVEVASSKGLLAAPPDIPDRSLEVGFRFAGK